MGVTNPFFVKTLADWPHILKINDIEIGNILTGIVCILTLNNIFVENSNANANQINSTVKKLSNRSLDMKTGVYTKYKTFLQKDREILKKLLKGIESRRPSEAQNILLRRFFAELTQSFLIPLERYFSSLMPLAKNLSPFKRPPILQTFKVEDFLSSIETTGPQLTTGIKGDWTGLYRRFLRSANFVEWYNAKLKEANEKILTLHIETLSDANIATTIESLPEVEIVDLILKLKHNLNSAQNGTLCLSNHTISQLKGNIDIIIEKLPEDSRSLFKRN